MSQEASIYLDYAAATPLDPRVFARMEPFYQTDFYNPSATYTLANEVRKSLEAARVQSAYWLGAQANEVVFTAGGTEANNLTIHGVMRKFPDANMVISSIEHESIMVPAKHYDCRIVPVKPDGLVDLDALRNSIDEHTVLVSIMCANNEIGTIQPLREVARIVNEKKAERQLKSYPLYFHSDACQAANYLDLHASRLGVDLLTLNGGKMYGPKQSGALFVKRGIQLMPLIEGGGQERGLRSGTENVSGAIGFAEALDQAQSMRKEETVRLQNLQREFIGQLAQSIPAAYINGSSKLRLPNNVHVTLPGQDNERLLIALDEAGIQAAAGSACSASNEEPSHVLRAIGLSDDDAQSSIRFTMGRATTGAMIQRTLQVLGQLSAP